MNQQLSEWDRWLGLRATPEILEAVAEGGQAELGLQNKLRKQFHEDLVRLAFQLTDNRKRAAGRFHHHENMWFDRVGLEQASSEAVSSHKALRFEEGVTWDLCCGVGGDALALATRSDVVAVDRDPARALCARWNTELYGVGSRVTVVVADVLRMNKFRGLVHVDPDQRAGGHIRSHRIEDAVPGRDYLDALTVHAEGGAIKLSPAANFLGKFAGCEIELISVGRECKQAVVWVGGLAGSHSCFVRRRCPAGRRWRDIRSRHRFAVVPQENFSWAQIQRSSVPVWSIVWPRCAMGGGWMTGRSTCQQTGLPRRRWLNVSRWRP